MPVLLFNALLPLNLLFSFDHLNIGVHGMLLVGSRAQHLLLIAVQPFVRRWNDLDVVHLLLDAFCLFDTFGNGALLVERWLQLFQWRFVA